ncbi:MAG TPA: translocation/assembly module TamB domain-containing protein, partial [Polyangiaceae bacterium]|nr:translocation/assembly module TamB domain-containing protein [Polyangiaceae bacterium]
EFELTSLGLKLSDVDLAARAESEGSETRITFDRLTGHTGEQKRVVRVQRGRLWLKGLEFNRADGAIDASELPLVIQGIPQAIATTRQSIAFTVERTPQEIRAQFQIPYLIVALPQSLGRNVIPLDENRSVTVLQPLAAPKLAQGDTLPFRLSFDLGQNVKLTRSDLDLPLSGQAEVRLADEVDVHGDLDLSPGGRIDVSGKTFVIDSGEVHFDTGEPNNPRIRVTASYRAPDGSIVTADMAGTLKKANLRVSSPGRTEQEAYAILLGSSTSVDDSSAAGARAAGAGVGADRLLGPLLQNTPLHRVELRTGSERVANQRTYSTYTAAVPVAEDIWFEGSYKSLNRTNVNNDTVSAWSGTVDWRFRRNWSLRTEVGTIGTGMDVLWNYRY